MTDRHQPLAPQVADAIFDILAKHGCASEREDAREDFVRDQTREHITEYRLGGKLGFGGKFWRNPGFLPDGTTRAERWYVNTYKEDLDDLRQAAIDAANSDLEQLRATTQSPDPTT